MQNVRNRLLRSLGSATREALQRGLSLVAVDSRQLLYLHGDYPRFAYFPNQSVACLVLTLHDGHTPCVGIVGSDGVIGVVEPRPLPFDVVMITPGDVWRLPLETFHDLDRLPVVSRILALYREHRAYEDTLLIACSASHSVRQRLCHIILRLCVSEIDSCIVTQDQLALLLGTRRATVTHALAVLQRDGLIERHRRKISIVDRPALAGGACECYHLICDHSSQLFLRAETSGDS